MNEEPVPLFKVGEHAAHTLSGKVTILSVHTYDSQRDQFLAEPTYRVKTSSGEIKDGVAEANLWLT